MAARPLKSVPDGSPQPRKTPAKSAPVTVRAAAESGDERAELVRMRNRVAGAIDDPETLPRDLAALTRRMQELAKDLKALDAREGEAGAGGKPAPDESFDQSAI